MRLSIGLAILGSLLLLVAVAAVAAEPTVEEIIAKSDDLMRGDTSYSELTMKIVTPHFEREVRMKAWTQGRDKAFIQVLAPAKDAGVTFLKLGREMWNYLPNVERTVKIPPSMMSQSWMGSDFSNNDLARSDTMIVDYTHRVAGEENVGGDLCWKIESTAKPDAPVVHDRIVSWVAKGSYVVRRAQYFDEDNRVAREMTVDQIVTVGGRKIGSHMVMTNAKKPGNQTEMWFAKMQFDLKIPPDTFTQRNLTRGVR